MVGWVVHFWNVAPIPLGNDGNISRSQTRSGRCTVIMSGEGMPNMCVRTELWPESCRNYGPKSHRPRGSIHTHIQHIHTSYTNGPPPSTNPSPQNLFPEFEAFYYIKLNPEIWRKKSTPSPGQFPSLSCSREYTLYNNQIDALWSPNTQARSRPRRHPLNRSRHTSFFTASVYRSQVRGRL